jgi:hypothetical protein
VERDNNLVMRRRKKLLGEVGGEATTRMLVRERDGTDRAWEKGERKRERERGGESGVNSHVKNAVAAVVGMQMVVQHRWWWW